MNMVFVFSNESSNWQSLDIACAARRIGIQGIDLLEIHSFLSGTVEAQSVCSRAGAVVIHYQPDLRLMSAIQHWKARGKTIILDLEGSELTLLSPDENAQLRWTAALVDETILPFPHMLEKWAGCSQFTYIPDLIDIECYTNVHSYSHPGIRIGCFPLPSQQDAFRKSDLLPALEEICSIRPNVQVAMFNARRDLFDELQVPPEQKMLFEVRSQPDWIFQLSQLDLFLSAPGDVFDVRHGRKCLLECMAMKIPWAASDVAAFHEWRPYGWLVNNTRSAWLRVITDIIDHLPRYRDIVTVEPYLFALEHDIKSNFDRLLSCFGLIPENQYTT